LTPDYPISISPYQKHPEFALSSTMERKIENMKLSVLSMSIPQLWPHYLQADPRFSENSICIEGPYIMKPCNSMLLCNQG
jgi:hypothetical protein